MRGMGRIFKRGSVYWIAYSYDGQEYRESAKSEHERDAVRLLKKRLGEIGRGRLVGPSEEKVFFENLASDYEREGKLRGRKSRWAKASLAHLREHLGRLRALDITTARVRQYMEDRRAEGAAAGTVNRELAVLGRMFALAIQGNVLTARPYLPKLKEAEPRQGFFEYSEYLAVKQNLPVEYQDVVEFGYFSGWRRGEIVSLEWRDIDRTGRVIRLRGAQSKNSQGRTLALEGPLAALIERRWRSRLVGSPFVFHRSGQPVGDWRKRWATACIKAGFFRIEPEGRKVPTKLFHDLRRTVARNLIRSGVPERIAMSITGHKTRSVFDRYDIVNETDIRQATVRLAQHVAGQALGGNSGARQATSSRRSNPNSDSSRTIGRSDREQATLQVVGKAGADDRT